MVSQTGLQLKQFLDLKTLSVVCVQNNDELHISVSGFLHCLYMIRLTVLPLHFIIFKVKKLSTKTLVH